MGIKTKGGMFCFENCKRPVAAVKTGHGVRNSLASVGALGTAGMSLGAVKVEGWHCPTCGGPVVSVKEWNRLVAKAQHDQTHRAAVASPQRGSQRLAPNDHRQQLEQCRGCGNWVSPNERCRKCG